MLSSTESFTTSQRRTFLRDVYDYARSLGLDKKEAKQQTIKAREICGEDEYNTDVSALENEIDDSELILSRLQDPIPPRKQANTMPGGSKILPPSRENSWSSRSDGSASQSQKRKRNGAETEMKSGRASHAATVIPRRTTANQSSNRIAKGRQPKQVRGGIHGPASSENKSFQRNGVPSDQPRRNTNTSSTERELILIAKPVPSYDPANPDRDSASLETNAGDKKMTSHSNVAGITSIMNFPATNSDPKNVKASNQNFASPEVAMFSDDDM